MLLKKRLSPGLPQHSLRFYAACLRLNPIAVGNQIVGGLLDLIRRQLRFASRGRHIVHRWKGAVGSTAGQQDGGRSRNQACVCHASKASITRRSCPHYLDCVLWTKATGSIVYKDQPNSDILVSIFGGRMVRNGQ